MRPLKLTMHRYGSATLLSLYNKWMFSPQYYNFPFPLFVTACHMVVQFTLAAAVRIVFQERYRPVERPSRQDYVYVQTRPGLTIGPRSSPLHSVPQATSVSPI
jgi:hypothetical protein